MGVFFSCRDRTTGYRDILEENLFQSALDLRLGRRFTFQQDNDPKHTAKITKEWLRNNSVTILDWPSQSPDLNPIEHHWRDLKLAVHQRSPSNLTELERICKEEWQRIPKSRCEKLVASFPRRGDASTQYWAKGLNTYDHVIFQFFFFNKFAKMSTFLFFSVKMGCWVYINEK